MPEEVIQSMDLCLQQMNSAVIEAQQMSHDATLVTTKFYANLHLCLPRQVLTSPQINLSQRDKNRLFVLPIGGNDLFGPSAMQVEDLR